MLTSREMRNFVPVFIPKLPGAVYCAADNLSPCGELGEGEPSRTETSILVFYILVFYIPLLSYCFLFSVWGSKTAGCNGARFEMSSSANASGFYTPVPFSGVPSAVKQAAATKRDVSPSSTRSTTLWCVGSKKEVSKKIFVLSPRRSAAKWSSGMRSLPRSPSC